MMLEIVELLDYQPATTIQIAKYFVSGRIWHIDWPYNNKMVIAYLKVDRDLDDVDAHGNHMTSGGAVVPGSTDSLTLYWVVDYS